MSRRHFYDFDGFRIDIEDRVLLREGEIVPLTQKAFDVLFLLIQRSNRLVTKEELMSEVWPDTFVEEGNLAQNIYTLRKVLGEYAQGEDYIRTVPRRGYRFVALVRETWEVEETPVTELPTAELLRQVELKEKKGGGDSDAVAKLKEFAAEKEMAPLAPAVGRRGKSRVVVVAGILIVAVLVLGWYLSRRTVPPPFANVTIANLTMAGNVQSIAVTPDGKYAVYGQSDKAGLSSLQVTQLSSSTARTIIAPAPVYYHGVTVSPDGSEIYVVSYREGDSVRKLSKLPFLGGVETKLLENVEAAVAISPDGERIAFRRGANDRRQSLLVVANADGTGEREIAALPYPESFGEPAWSPDGETIACAAGHAEGGKNRYVIAIRLADGSRRTITRELWRWIGQMAWMPDGSALILVGNKEATEPMQVWSLAYPSGETRRITNDTSSYNRMGMSADGKVIVALHQKRLTSLWISPAVAIEKAEPLTFGIGGYRGRLAWTHDGRIVYDSEAGNVTAISMIDADGSNPRRLTGEATQQAVIGSPAVTPDGRYIVYFSDLAGKRNLWRMNLDGSNPVQLTSGTGEEQPACSPDGKWVVYTQKEMAGIGKPTLWKVSIDGGQPIRLIDSFAISPVVSPDGKLVACAYAQSQRDPWRIALVSFDDGRLLKVFPQTIAGSPLLRWMPDGSGIAYDENPIGSAKLWMQPVEGGERKLLLEFETDRIFGFDWSKDGKRFAVVRGIWALNAVTITESK